MFNRHAERHGWWHAVARIAATVIAAVIVSVTSSGDMVGFKPAAAQTVGSGGICDRTPAVQAGILRMIPDVTDCADVTAAQLAAPIVSITLRGLTAVSTGDFAGLSGLERLEIIGDITGKLTTLPVGVFKELTNLQLLIFGR